MRLRSFLILMAAAILLPVIAFSAIALHTLQQAERQAALEGLHETAQTVALMVERELHVSQAALRVLGSSYHLESGDMARFYEQARSINRGAHNWTVLLDERGSQVINTLVPFELPLPSSHAEERVRRVRSVLESNATVVTGVITGPLVKRLVTTLNVPVTLPDGRRFVLTQAFGAEYFQQLIREAAIPEGWIVAIIDTNGKFVARNGKGADRTGTPAKPELVEAASRQNTGMIEHATLEGVASYDVFTHSPLSGWTIAIAAPTRLIESSAVQATLLVSFGMLFALVCAATVARFFGGYLVKAIGNAASIATALGDGRWRPNTPTLVHEIDELNRALTEAGISLSRAQAYRLAAEAERQTLLNNEQEARQRAESENRAKDQFLAMLGHELRNPLAPISAAAQLLSLPGADSERIQQVAQVIDRQVRHMNHLVNDLLDVSRVTSGLVAIQKQPVELCEIVDTAVEQTRPLFEAKAHTLTAVLPQEPLWISGDATRLIQICTNLLSNAAKYTPDRGAISLVVNRRDDWALIDVSDNGQGIDDDLLPRVFDLFSQAERTPDRTQGGLGLGLALVKNLVEQHGGTVTAASAGLGRGSRFSVRLPCLPAAPQQSEQTVSSASIANRARTVAIVDDNADAADMMAAYLDEIHGHPVETFRTASALLGRVKEKAFDVYVLDIGLPDMTGYDLVRRLRAMPSGARALTIALTGYTQEDDRRAAAEAGFDRHLAKPTDAGTLAALIADAAPPIRNAA